VCRRARCCLSTRRLPGEHTLEILEDHGFSPEEIEALASQGIVSSTP
jgi:hypothetical protein